MSYSLSPYVVDLDELRRVVGSADEAFLSAVYEAGPEHFDDAESDEDEIPLSRALRHLVMGEPRDGRSAHQYGYALEELCRYLGEEPVGTDLWSGIHWDVIEATGVSEVLRTGPPVPLPPLESGPTIGYLEASQVAAILAMQGERPLKTAAPSGRKPRPSFRAWLLGLLMARLGRRAPLTAEEVRELLDIYRAWLEEAAESSRGLVLFYS